MQNKGEAYPAQITYFQKSFINLTKARAYPSIPQALDGLITPSRSQVPYQVWLNR
jgi:hypothetical protein